MTGVMWPKTLGICFPVLLLSMTLVNEVCQGAVKQSSLLFSFALGLVCCSGFFLLFLILAGLHVRGAQPAAFSPSLWHCPSARAKRGRSRGWQRRNQGTICVAFVHTEGSHTVRSSQLDTSGWSPALLNGSSNSEELEHTGESGPSCLGFVV